MKAVFIEQTGDAGALRYADFPKPEPASGQVLVKLAAAGVNFIDTPSDLERRDQFTVRVDHEFSANSHLFGRYTFANDSLGNAAYRVGLGLIRPDQTQVPVIGYTRVISPTLIS